MIPQGASPDDRRMKLNKLKRFFGSQTSYGVSGILQNLQNLIVVVICLLLFWIMITQIVRTGEAVLEAKSFRDIAGHLMYLFVMTELFRLMIHYLEEQRILLGTIIEVTIVSLLREIILDGVLAISWDRLLAVCALILTLTATLVVHHRLEKGRAKLGQITIAEVDQRRREEEEERRRAEGG